ncbi:MAG: hypothetical protein ACYCW6_00070 [Candidatus Xenobia bacterium]
MISLPSGWAQKPPAGTPINWGHPLARGLDYCIPFTDVQEVNGPFDVVQHKIQAASGTHGTFIANKYGPGFWSGFRASVPAGSLPASYLLLLNLDTTGNNQYFFNDNAGNVIWLQLYLQKLRVGLTTSGTEYYDTPSTYSGQHVALVVFGSNSVALYVDGVLVINQTGLSYSVSPSGLTVSNNTGNSTIHGLWRWQRALTADEALALYHNPWAMFAAPTLPFSYGSQTASATAATAAWAAHGAIPSVEVAATAATAAWSAHDATDQQGQIRTPTPATAAWAATTAPVVLVYPPPTPFRCVLMDRNRTQVAEIQDAANIWWSWTLPGGCDQAQLELPSTYESYTDLYEYRVDLWYAGQKVWAGLVDTWEPDLETTEKIILKCVGYGSTMAQRTVAQYAAVSTDAATAMNAVLKSYIGLGAPSPLYDMSLGSIVAAGYSPSTYNATQRQVSDIVNELSLMGQAADGTPYQWIVDQSRVFSYQAPTTAVNRWAVVGRDVIRIDIQRGPMSQVKNSLYVTGTIDGTGNYATGTYNDQSSINTYGQKDGVIQLTGLNDTADMQRGATAVLARSSYPQDRATVYLQNNRDERSLLDYNIGDVLEVRGFKQGLTMQGRVMQMKYQLDDNGLQLQASLNAAPSNFKSMFLSAAGAHTNALLAEFKRAQVSGLPLIAFPWVIGKSVFLTQ